MSLKVGHFEPLRHYAEVHLLLEPGDPGSGLQFGTECSEDMFKKLAKTDPGLFAGERA